MTRQITAQELLRLKEWSMEHGDENFVREYDNEYERSQRELNQD